jgi:phage shock protein A
MTLLTRVSRLFQADLHAVLDQIEEPEVLLRQSIREMDEALNQDQRQLKLLLQEQRQLGARQGEIDQSLADLEQQLDLCFAAGQDDLARGLVRRKLETQRLATLLGQKRQTLDDHCASLAQRIAENRSLLEQMHQKAELLGEQEPPPVLNWSPAELAVGKEDVEVAFLREQQRRKRS